MKYFIIAGEASGDLHASDVVRELMALDDNAEIIGMGGALMQKAGAHLIVDYSAYSFMGFVEVIQNLRKISKLLKRIKSEIIQFKPDKVILVDYGGFNLKIARFCKEANIQTHFYILPKVWAWNEKRVKKIKMYVDHAYCIFPFEESYFNKHGVNAMYIGNPVVDQIIRFKQTHPNIEIKDQIALLPGSRKQEVTRILPVMLAFANTKPELNFVIAAHDSKMFSTYQLPPNVRISDKGTYTVVASSKIAIVASGTATLETALLNTPQVVVYAANAFSYAIGKRLVKIKFISPVNLILDKLVIKELLQDDFNVVHLEIEINELSAPEQVKLIQDAYQNLWKVLSKKSAGRETAKNIIES